MATRNVTLALPEDLLKQTKVYAALRDTSISALVTDLLRQEMDQPSQDELWEQAFEVMKSGSARVGPVNWKRDEVHQR
jgi:hypothetical protein